MNFYIAETFTKSLTKLESEEQSLVKMSAFDFQANPSQPGFQFHRVDKSKDDNFWSARVNQDLRIIVHKSSNSIVLCYADHHDEAYAWAERRKLEAHPETGAAQFVEVTERTEEIVQRIVKQEVTSPALFDDYDDGYLLALGVPREWLEAVKHVGWDRLPELIEHLPEEAMERLMNLAEGKPVPHPGPPSVEVHPLSHPDARRRFRLIDDQQQLRQALEYPWEKWIVFLHPEQREVVGQDYSGPARVYGSAGTGKSVVALHRAARLARVGEGQVLLTTFSKTLASRLAQNAELLLGADAKEWEDLEIRHLHAIAREIWVERSGKDFRPVQKNQLEKWIREGMIRAGIEDFSESFLQSEWEAVIDYWGIRDWAGYRDVSRAGRGTPLGARQRKKLWEVFGFVRNSMEEIGAFTWNDLCRDCASLIEDDPLYRNVVIDESQDFGPADLILLRALAPEAGNDLFLCGDEGQRIYKRGFSWLQAGIDIRGRSSKLRINYRTTEQIRKFADALLPRDLVGASETSEERDAISLLTGREPEFQAFANSNAESRAIVEFVQELLDRGFEPQEIAVFARTKKILGNRVTDPLENAGIPIFHLQDNDDKRPDAVAVGTMHRAKGLEFKAVIIAGCDHNVMPYARVLDRCVDEEEKREFVGQERRLLYVACTRPRERLLVTSVGEASRFLTQGSG